MRQKAGKRTARPRASDIKRCVKWIRAQHTEADTSPEISEYERAPQVLKRLVYKYVRVLRQRDLLGKARAFVAKRDGDRFLDEEANPFLLGLRMVDEDNWVGKQNRSKYAAEMYYADLHNIRSELLTPFIASIGSYPLLKKKLARQPFVEETWAKAFARSREVKETG